MNRRSLPAFAFLALSCLPISRNEAARGADTDPESAPKRGVVAGRISYQPDAKRPWRYARYYIKDRKTGLLAEAVVCLISRSLKNYSPRKQPTVPTIDQKNFQFTPETIAIRAGDFVKFTNSDKQIHNVKSLHRYHHFNVNMAAGGEHMERFQRAGGIRLPYRIGCIYHGAMRAWVFVFDHPFYHVTTRNGEFRFGDVPPGEYISIIMHPAGELSWSKKVEVRGGETLELDIRVSPNDKISKVR